MKKIWSLASMILLMAVSAAAQEASPVGTWTMKVETPNGVNTSTLVLRQDGDKLVGVLKSPRGERPLDSAAVKGNEITMVLTVQFQGQDLVITYKGTIDSNMMKGEADFGGLASGPWSAERADGAAAGAAPAAAAPASGAFNISGNWKLTVETPRGTNDTMAEFKQEGETLTGTIKGQRGERAVTGSVKGSEVTFIMKLEAQGQELEIVYSGKLENATTMKGTVKFGSFGEGTWTATKE